MSHRTRYRGLAPTVVSRRRMRDIARAWRAAEYLASAAAVAIGRDAAQELLGQVRGALRLAAEHEVSLLRMPRPKGEVSEPTIEGGTNP